MALIVPGFLADRSDRILEQLVVTDITSTVGDANVFAGDERVGATVRRAYEDALRWVSE